MDAQARKAMYREKLREKEKKRIDSPLLTYNEYNQPVCRVCNLPLKSDSLWPAHQVSQKHQEAVRNLKAAASNGVKLEQDTNVINKARTASALPADFFDQQDSKKSRADLGVGVKSGATSRIESVDSRAPHTSQMIDITNVGHGPLNYPESKNKIIENKGVSQLGRSFHLSENVKAAETNQTRGVLPEGFFDNKDADLRARGIEPVKPDMKDELKEFEKAIQEDLQGVDDRLEEEAIDAAELGEEAESYVKQAGWERVEFLKKKVLEQKTAKLANEKRKAPKFRGEESSGESSSDEGSDREIDWRAQHL